MQFEVSGIRFIRAETIGATKDCIFLRVPIEDTKMDAIVRLDVQCYVSSLDATDLLKVLADSETDAPKTLTETGR